MVKKLPSLAHAGTGAVASSLQIANGPLRIENLIFLLYSLQKICGRLRPALLFKKALAQFAIESETWSNYGLPEQLADTLRNGDGIRIQSPDGPRLRQLHFLAGERDGRGAHDLGGASQAGERGIHQRKPSIRMYLQHARINQGVEQQQSRVHIRIKIQTALAVCVNTETGDEVGGNQRSHRLLGQRAAGGLEGHAIGAPLLYGPE